MTDEVQETLDIGTMVGKKYKVIQKLGEGGCGSVFKVEDTEDKGTPYAMKVEFNSAIYGSVLKMEVQILTLLRHKKHVAKCVASGKKTRFCYMVMTLLGSSLDSLVSKHGPFFNVSTQIRVGISVLFGIKQIHDIGYIHRDLKPANVALGYKGSVDERLFMVLDFGLARQYVTDEDDGKKMRRPRSNAHFRGTRRYCSISMHDNFEQGRVDDLWALIYILAELRCRLAWHDVEERVAIGDMKKSCTDEMLLAKSPVQLLEFVNIVRNTKFYDRPDYEKLYKLLDDVMKKGEYKWSDPYHWEIDKEKEKEKEREKKREKSNEKDNEKEKVKEDEPAGKAPKPKKLALMLSSMKSVRKKKSKAKPPQPAVQSPAISTTESFESCETPYFTTSDFKSNPLGF